MKMKFTFLNQKALRLFSMICLICSMSFTNVFADHIWETRNLAFTENPVGSEMYDITFEYYVDAGLTANWVYWEMVIVENGCNASDGFTSSATDCYTGVGQPDGWNAGTLATGIQFCPGKEYSIVLYTRRRGDEGGAPCGNNEDRGGGAVIDGDGGGTELTQWPNIAAGDPATIWAGTPIDALGDTPTYDGNWAYQALTFTSSGSPLWQFAADIDVDDCLGAFDQSYSGDDAGQTLTNVTENFGGAIASVRCGAPITATYNSNNSCGPGFPGNTYMVTDNSTVSGFNGASSGATGAGIVDDGGNGRFEVITDVEASGFACGDGDISIRFENSDCTAEDAVVTVDISYEVDVHYPTSNFADPVRINCSDVPCGQDLVLAGSDPQWLNSAGINMGNSTTLMTSDAVDQGFTFAWSGQICTTNISADACDFGSGSVNVDECQSCGVYEITYAIANTNCPSCATTTTKQVEIVSPLITNLASDITEGCGELTPNITFDVVECNPTDGSATTTAYTGTGDMFLERDDNAGTLMPMATANTTVTEGNTVCFTAYFQNAGCTSCNTVSTGSVCVTSNVAPPEPAGITVTESMCNITIDNVEGGSFDNMTTADACATGTLIFYSDAAGTMSIATPTYDQEGPAQTFYVSCMDMTTNCESPLVQIGSTNPGACACEISEMTLTQDIMCDGTGLYTVVVSWVGGPDPTVTLTDPNAMMINGVAGTSINTTTANGTATFTYDINGVGASGYNIVVTDPPSNLCSFGPFTGTTPPTEFDSVVVEEGDCTTGPTIMLPDGFSCTYEYLVTTGATFNTDCNPAGATAQTGTVEAAYCIPLAGGNNTGQVEFVVTDDCGRMQTLPAVDYACYVCDSNNGEIESNN